MHPQVYPYDDVPESAVAPSPAATSTEAHECTICMQVRPLRTTSCGHFFCEPCLGTWAMKCDLQHPVPCPACRRPLADDDIPKRATLVVATPTLGLTLASHCDDLGPCVRIVRLAAGSPLEISGLRVGMCLLAVEGVEVTTAEMAAERIEECSAPHVSIVVGPLRSPHWRGDADQSTPCSSSVTWKLAGWCCCNVTAQVWQRAHHRPPSTCVRLASTLWIIIMMFLAAEAASRTLAYSSGRPLSFPLDFAVPWRVVNLTDDVLSTTDVAWFLGVFVACPMLLLNWLLCALLLKGARDRIRRDEPELWEASLMSVDERNRFCVTHAWIGPLFNGWCLSAHLLRALTAGKRYYSLCRPLDPPEMGMAVSV